MPAALEFLTVNLWGLPWPASRHRRRRKRRLREHLAENRYDVVGIQELWWPWRRAFDLASLVVPRTRRDSGLALGGRLPVRGPVRVEHFTHHRGPDRLKRKGVLWARVETEGRSALAVGVVHLQAERRYARVRERQVEQLLRSVEAERRPVVLMGDFNLHRSSEEDRRSARRLREAGLLDSAESLAREEPTFAASNPYLRRRRVAERFDRVYVRDSQEVRLQPREVSVVESREGPFSDHHALRVRIEVRD